MGPLKGIKVIQLGGIGPVPLTCMMLADMGADVLRIDPPGARTFHTMGIHSRGTRSMVLDLKKPRAAAIVLKLVEGADVLIEGNRPGVAERLGVGPDECRARNPRLIYGRLTSYGQTGELAMRPAHDINAVAMSGVLHALGPAGQPPQPPQALVGDFGGGGMTMLAGVLAALVETSRSGLGQVIDCSMADGAALLGAYLFEMHSRGTLPPRGTGMLDGAAPYFSTYETADGKYVAVGANEPWYYEDLLKLLGLAPEEIAPQKDETQWPRLKARVAAVFKTRTRDQWCAVFAEHPNCFAPVLAPGEVADDPHHRSRGSFFERDGILQPAPAPRFSRTPSEAGPLRRRMGEHAEQVLSEAGFSAADIADLRADGTLVD